MKLWTHSHLSPKFEKCLNNKAVITIPPGKWELAAIAGKILNVPVGFLNMQNNPKLYPAFKNIKYYYWRAYIL